MKSRFRIFVTAVICVMLLLTTTLTSGAFVEAIPSTSECQEQVGFLLTEAQLATARLSNEDIPEALTSTPADFTELVYRARALEDEYSLVFQKQDGTCQKFVFSEKIQYLSSDGVLKDKSTKLVENDSIFVAEQTDVVVKMPKNLANGIMLNYDELNLMMKPVESRNYTTNYAKGESSIRYNQVFDEFTDVVYSVAFSGVKCDIILNEYAGKNNFSFEIQTNGYGLTENKEEKNISITDEGGNKIAQFDRIVSYDATGKISYGDLEIKNGNKVNTYILTITVDNDFLTDPNTVYPIVVDPSTTVTHGDPGLQYRAVYSSSPQSGSDLYVGSVNGGVGRALYKFQGIAIKQLIHAELIQCVRTQSDFFTIKCYAYQGTPWDSNSSYGSLDFTRISNTVQQAVYGNYYGNNTKYMTIDITDFIGDCLDNSNGCSFEKGVWIVNDDGEIAPQYIGTDSNTIITTTIITSAPEYACFSPYVVYTYEPYKVMLDAGHCAIQSQYVPTYQYNGISFQYYEGNQMWKLQNYLKSYLSTYGFVVGTTRTDQYEDKAKEDRGLMAEGYDLFLSLHSNGNIATTNYINVWCVYLNGYLNTIRELGSNLSNAVTNVLIPSAPPMRFYGRDDTMLSKCVNVGCDLCMIIEHGFQDNMETAYYLSQSSYLMAIAHAEADVIFEYFLNN